MKALTTTAEENRNTELELQLFDSAGQARLRYIAPLRSSAEMTFFRDGNQILKLPDEHSSDSLRSGRFVMMIDRILNRQELTNQRNYRANFTAPQQAFVRSKNANESRS